MTPVGPSRTSPRDRRPAPARPVAPRRGGTARDARPAPRPRPRPRTSPAGRSSGPWRAGRPHLRLVASLLVLLVGFGAITVRLVQVQALGGEEYTAYGASQRFQDIALPAERGSIFDRNGNDLAVSLPQRTIWANPQLIDHPLEVAVPSRLHATHLLLAQDFRVPAMKTNQVPVENRLDRRQSKLTG